MRWDGERESGNVVDRRGLRTGGIVGGGGILLAIVYALLGGDPRVILNQGGGDDTAASQQQPDQQQPKQAVAGNDDQRRFVGVVLADTEDTWHTIFQRMGRQYEEPKLVLFTDRVRSACGTATSAAGPFYCPSDRQVYLDLGFFTELSQRLGAGGDFARAYVIAHEVGHHVQNLLGLMSHPAGGNRNAASVKTELQADCLAGVWAKETDRTKHFLESGDIDSAVTAAAAVGDDRLQKQAQGYVVPDSFTHGSSAQRVAWFKKGLEAGTVEGCDTSAVAH